VEWVVELPLGRLSNQAPTGARTVKTEPLGSHCWQLAACGQHRWRD
jgi:hypothetical protein